VVEEEDRLEMMKQAHSLIELDVEDRLIAVEEEDRVIVVEVVSRLIAMFRYQ
jgi:hypothetical protein